MKIETCEGKELDAVLPVHGAEEGFDIVLGLPRSSLYWKTQRYKGCAVGVEILLTRIADRERVLTDVMVAVRISEQQQEVWHVL